MGFYPFTMKGRITMLKNKYLFLFGAAVILFGLIAALVFSIRDQQDSERKPETTTQHKEKEESKSNESSNEVQRDSSKEVRGEDCIEVHDIGHLYYLDPEGDQTFERRLTHFVTDEGIKAGTAEVMDYCIDNREKEKELAQFFLILDDRQATIVRVCFEKTTGTYWFNLYDGSLPDLDEEAKWYRAGEPEEEIPENVEEEEVKKSKLTIIDPEGELKATAKMKELKKHLRKFLRSEGEGRRNFYVDSVTVTEDGYQALLCFETARQDGRNVEVTFDGEYHFRFV